MSTGELLTSPQSQSDADDALSIPGSSFSFDSKILQALFPLQRVADRVSVQVEEFAINVDEWALEFDASKDDPAKRHTRTLELLNSLHDVIRDTVSTLQSKRSSTQPHELSKSWRGRIQEVKDIAASISRPANNIDGRSADLEDTKDDIQHSQAEANTWDLLRRLVDLHFPNPTIDVEESRREYLDLRGEIDEHTPKGEIWERFILANDDAREKKIVLNWLEDCANPSDSELEAIIEKLETIAGTDRGTWSHGWLNTRERIKADKRIRSLTAPLKESTISVLNSERTGDLITQLDPDAPSRQQKGLEKIDEIHERSLWLACFAMFRRGIAWEEIREWCEERREGWRAVSFGMAEETQDARICLAGSSAGVLFRRMCFAASRRTGAYEYERAVYGLLAGDIESVEPVCWSWDDFLYAYYNAILTASFETFLQDECQGKIPPALLQRFPQPNQAGWSGDGNQVIERLKYQKSSTREAHTPIKLIQGALLSRTFPQFVRNVGIAMSKAANAEERTPLIPPTTASTSEDFSDLFQDFDAIRLIVHLLILYEAFNGPIETSTPADRALIENIHVYYLNFLRVLRKIEAIPTYARFLSQPRREEVVGVIMVDVVESSEQKRLVSLMKGTNIYIPRVMASQLEFAMARMGLEAGGFKPVDRFEMLESTNQARWPGQRIRADLMPSEASDAEERLIRAAEWFLHIRSQWRVTFDGLTMALKAFLLSGRWSAAVEFTRRIPFYVVSRQKSVLELGRPVDVFQELDNEEEQPVVEEQRSFRRTRASSRQPSLPPPSQPRVRDQETEMIREMLKAQSRQCLEMQQLCTAIERLVNWRQIEEANPPLGMEDLKSTKRLRAELEELSAAMEPLLRPDFMTMILDGKHPFLFCPISPSLPFCQAHTSSHTGSKTHSRRRKIRLHAHPPGLPPNSHYRVRQRPHLRRTLPGSRNAASRVRSRNHRCGRGREPGASGRVCEGGADGRVCDDDGDGEPGAAEHQSGFGAEGEGGESGSQGGREEEEEGCEEEVWGEEEGLDGRDSGFVGSDEDGLGLTDLRWFG